MTGELALTLGLEENKSELHLSPQLGEYPPHLLIADYACNAG